MNTNELIELVKTKYYTDADLDTKSNESTFLRSACCLAVIDLLGKTNESVGKDIGRNHSTITHYKLRVHPQMLSDAYYAKCYLFACELVRENSKENTPMTIIGLYRHKAMIQNELKLTDKLIEDLQYEPIPI